MVLQNSEGRLWSHITCSLIQPWRNFKPTISQLTSWMGQSYFNSALLWAVSLKWGPVMPRMTLELAWKSVWILGPQARWGFQQGFDASGGGQVVGLTKQPLPPHLALVGDAKQVLPGSCSGVACFPCQEPRRRGQCPAASLGPEPALGGLLEVETESGQGLSTSRLVYSRPVLQ